MTTSAPTAMSRVRDALDRLGIPSSGNKVRCPAHEDVKASLSVQQGDRLKGVVLHCHAGCTPEAVVKALGLTMRDLSDGLPRRQTTTYEYRDHETGLVLFKQVRRDPEKRITTTPSGAQKRLQRLPLYNGHRLASLGDEPVYLVEGEKSAYVLNEWLEWFGRPGLAVTHANGANSWRSYYAEYLAGRQVLVIADRDEAGLKWAAQIARDLEPLASSLTFRQSRTTGAGDDVVEHLNDDGFPDLGALVTFTPGAADGPTEDQPDERVEYFLDRMRAQHEARELLKAEQADLYAVTLPRQTLRQAQAAPRPDVPLERISGLHRVGYNSTITAQYKTGKTTLGGNLLRSLVDGDPFLDRFEVLKPDGRVGLLNYELSDEDMLDWLADQGIVNDDQVAVLNLRGVPFSLASPRNQDELVAWCQEMGVEVLHLDPHRRAFAGFGEENNNDDVNRFTAALDEIKKRAEVSDLFLYVHTGRQGGEMGAERARGATALDDWADQRWLLTKDADSQDRFLYADGRLPFVPEFKLTYDRATRRLTAGEGNRRTASADRYREGILAALEVVREAGANVGALESKLGVTKKGGLAAAIDSLRQDGLVVQGQRGTAKPLYLREHAPEEFR